MNVLFLVLVLANAVSPPAAKTAAKKPAKPLLVTMNEVVSKLVAQKDSPRVSAGSGTFGVGSYVPRGGVDWAPGYAATPLQVLPRAGLGVSLNLDPITGRPY